MVWRVSIWVHRCMTNNSGPTDVVGQSDDNATGDESTITSVLEGYAQGGFSSSFIVTDESEVECVECSTVSAARLVSMSSLRRLEGASDPSDMIAVVALTCPACEARGTVILGFGPMATQQDSEVLENLRDLRGDSAAPGNSAHGETTGDESPAT
ncbi:MAG: hypothetical protein ABI862_10390 [Ilumatobacteraceae bacterium]